MNGINLYIIVSAVIVGVVSALLNFTGKKVYKDNATYYATTNHDLREENTSLRDEKASLATQLIKAQTESTQKDETIKQLKPFSDLAKIVSNNHKEVMQTMSLNFKDVIKAVTERVDGNK